MQGSPQEMVRHPQLAATGTFLSRAEGIRELAGSNARTQAGVRGSGENRLEGAASLSRGQQSCPRGPAVGK